MHGEDCLLVKTCDSATDGIHRFFKCPQAWVISISTGLFNTFVMGN